MVDFCVCAFSVCPLFLHHFRDIFLTTGSVLKNRLEIEHGVLSKDLNDLTSLVYSGHVFVPDG